MLTVTLALLAIAGVDPVCSPVITMPYLVDVRDEYVLLDATKDSVGVPFFEEILGGREPFTRYAPPDSINARPTLVYGQVFRVRSTAGRHARGIRAGAEVVVIWWGLGISCQRSRPYSATKPAIRSLFLHGTARPAADWADGTPLFYAWHTEYLYSPELPTARYYPETIPPEALPMEDFLQLLRLLPPARVLESSDSVAIALLFRWADAEPSRWRRQPAREVLCTALRARNRPRSHCPPSLRDHYPLEVDATPRGIP